MRMRKTAAWILVCAMLCSYMASFASAYDVEGKTPPELLQLYGLVEGDGTGDLRLSMGIRRMEMTVLLARLYGESEQAAAYTEDSNYADAAAIDEWARPYVAYARYRGWMKGDEFGVFNPRAQLGGEELAVLLIRLLGYEEQTWGSNRDHLERNTGIAIPFGNVMTRGELFGTLWQCVTEPVMANGGILLEERGIKPLHPQDETGGQILMNESFQKAWEKIIWLDERAEYVMPYSEGLALLRMRHEGGEKWVYIGESGEIRIELPILSGKSFHEGLAAVQVITEGGSALYGYIDVNGAMVIPAEFEEAGDFSNGFAVVVKKNPDGTESTGYIDRSGKAALDTSAYLEIRPFSDGLAAVKRADGRWIFINREGNQAFAQDFSYVEGYSEGMALFVNEEGLYGYLDTRGNVAIPATRYYIPSLNNGYAFANGRAMVFDLPVGLDLNAFDPQDLHKYCRIGFIDRSGDLVIAPKYPYAERFGGGYATVLLDPVKRTYGLISRSGELVFANHIEYICRIDNRQALIKVNGRWGIIHIKKP